MWLIPMVALMEALGDGAWQTAKSLED